MPVREIAQREAFDIAINASYFEIPKPKSGEIAEEKSERAGAPATTVPTTSAGYRAGVWSKTVGWAMSDGYLFSPKVRADWPAFWIDANGRAHLGDLKDVPPNARQMVQGNVWLVRDGKPVEPKGNAKVRHPRTIVGLDKSGTRLVLLTVDGRRPGTATGMNGAEMSAQVLRLGCTDAINLDGGGSATLVMYDPSDHQLKTMNQPSDLRERSVADVIGVSVKSR
jgi:exopolysaccharide biosynthesis protein